MPAVTDTNACFLGEVQSISRAKPRLHLHSSNGIDRREIPQAEVALPSEAGGDALAKMSAP